MRQLGERLRRNPHLLLSLLACVVGVTAGYGAIGFRYAIDGVQLLFYGSGSEAVLSMAIHLEWWHRLLAPALGGLLVGVMIYFLLPERRPHGVADVIEACAVRGGRMHLRDGLVATAASAASLGAGASVGREGPMVHLAATMASWLGKRLGLDRPQLITLLGCGAASGVAASFNAPIAGVFFALEVVVGHYGLGTFTPVVVSAVIGTIIARAHFGDFPAFVVPGLEISTYYELPAFFLLGLICAGVAILFIHGTLWTARVAARLPVPRWLLPGCGGLLVGCIAAVYPEVIGVGYETTDAALAGRFGLWLLIALVLAKTAATCISLGSGFAGGVFSPSLCIGALTGAAFGLVATGFVPDAQASASTYSLVGMGAVTGAVLGAPISTILIIFELTGDYATTIAVMVAVAVSSLTSRQLGMPSFFIGQLTARGVDLQRADERAATRAVPISSIMSDAFATVTTDTAGDAICDLAGSGGKEDLFVTDEEGRLKGMLPHATLRSLLFDPAADRDATAAELCDDHIESLTPKDTLNHALDLFETTDHRLLPVVDGRAAGKLIGVVQREAALRAYTRALLRQRAWEHGES